MSLKALQEIVFTPITPEIEQRLEEGRERVRELDKYIEEQIRNTTVSAKLLRRVSNWGAKY